MLTSLRIENFAIVSLLELDFNSGMTAFTGETGAGKSIMIDALMLALGGRSDISVIRPGAEKCDIQACFAFEPLSAPAQWLQEHDLEGEEGQLILRRIISSEGRSKSSINGHVFPLQKIKELSERLVDIHGQHQHQTLLQHGTHRQQLDQYAGHHHLLTKVNQLHRECEQTHKEFAALSQQAFSERMELLRFQIDELRSLDIQEDEMHLLHQEHQLLHHARDYLANAQETLDRLSENEDTAICRSLSQALHLMITLPQDNPHIKAAYDLLNSALIQCEEANTEIKHFFAQVHLDPARLQEVEERISLLHQAARKYHVEASQLLPFLHTLEEESDRLNGMENELTFLKHRLQQVNQNYEEAALNLRASRSEHASKLADEISQTIRQLGMPQGYILVEITPLDKGQNHGLDKVEYKVCTNPGMHPDTLSKIASGGELSRISLAIQMITAQRGATPTLLFDEVDVGIGGATAALVGKLLRKLGERLQIFCVTHQAQVASSAHHHFVVEKYTEAEQTYSKIIELQPIERVDEIARMLSGMTISEPTRSHARELIAENV